MTISPPLPHEDPVAAADQAAAELADLTGSPTHEVALVLGSGWLPAVDLLGETRSDFPATDLHGFAPPAVAGHAGRIRSVRLAEIPSQQRLDEGIRKGDVAIEGLMQLLCNGD